MSETARDLFTDSFRQLPIRDQLDGQVHRIVEGHKADDTAAVTHITCWPAEKLNQNQTI